MAFNLNNLCDLLKVAIEHKASDVHLRTNEPPTLRIRGDLVLVKAPPLTQEDIIDICKIVFHDKKHITNIDNINELDGSFNPPNICRLRYNFFRYKQQIGIIFRIIKNKIPSITELGLAPVTGKIAQRNRGLILLTGATGSGKSTTLASMIDHINKTRPVHVITIEDPIEFTYDQAKARISQREVGLDTENFKVALRGALRQDPDVISIGELRDYETISTALKASETGHAVFATVHTTDAVSTISRIIAMFPQEQQDEVKKRLSENLYATISQRLLKRSDSKGMLVAQEIMITGPGVKECILGTEPLGNINGIIKRGKGKGGNGSQSFDQHILDLFNNKKISKETALSAVASEADFMQQLIVN
ncbi:MAG: PilT/PilU family type 4a pilus ATPase [Bacteriovoracaceae bacterium]|nr:PilT/PilU family type 4a pilus ATPase [Bacteriovoracaceae bacterium]